MEGQAGDLSDIYLTLVRYEHNKSYALKRDATHTAHWRLKMVISLFRRKKISDDGLDILHMSTEMK